MMNDYILINGTLYHHGILGQKWGKRNGPPYPLKEGKHSKAEEDAKKKFHLTDKQKKYAKIGLAILGTSLAVYGGYRISKLKNFSDLGKKYSRSYGLLGYSSDISKQKLNKASEQVRNALKNVNPSEERNHCSQNALAACIKFKGIEGLENITTKPGIRSDKRGSLFEKCFKTSDGLLSKAINLNKNIINSAEDASKMIRENFNPKNGSCGLLEMPLSHGKRGHAIMWYMENNTIKYADPFFVDLEKNGYIIIEDASIYFGKAFYNKYCTISCLDNMIPNMDEINKYFNY